MDETVVIHRDRLVRDQTGHHLADLRWCVKLTAKRCVLAEQLHVDRAEQVGVWLSLHRFDQMTESLSEQRQILGCQPLSLLEILSLAHATAESGG